MDDLGHYDLIEYWHFRITRKKADGAFQSILHDATIKWFNNIYFEGTIIQLQNNDSFKVLSGYASSGPFHTGTMSFDVIADDGSVRNFHGNIIDETSIFGSCTSKGENKHDYDKSQWFALRYKKISHDVEEGEDEDDPICPYCKRKSSEGGCEHEIANTDPDLFDLDLEYPLMSKAYADIEWPEETLHKIFGNLRDVLDAHGDDFGCTLDLSKKPDVIKYFEKLMKKISCDFETRGYEFSGGPTSSYCGVIYYAENPREVHKQLNKTIQRLKRCFKKIEDQMNKGHQKTNMIFQIRDASGWLSIGLDVGFRGNYAFAIDAITKAIELCPGGAGYYFERGFINAWFGNNDKAIPDYSRAIEINPNSESAYLYRGRAYFESGFLVLALNDFAKCIKLRPESALAYQMHGWIYFILARYDSRQSIADFNKAIMLNPEEALNYYCRARVLSNYKAFDMELYMEHGSAGRRHAILENIKKAITNSGLAIKLDQESIVFFERVSMIDTPGLNTVINAVTPVDPNDHAYYKKNQRNDDRVQAIADYNKAIEINVQFSEAYYWRAICHDAEGDYDSMVADMKIAAVSGDKNAQAFLKAEKKFQTVKALYEAGEILPCLNAAQKILKVYPYHYFTLCYAGVCMYLGKQYSKAASIFTECLSSRRMPYYSMSFLSDAYYKLDMHGLAFTYYIYTFNLELIEYRFRYGKEVRENKNSQIPHALDALDHCLYYFDEKYDEDEIALFRRATIYLYTFSLKLIEFRSRNRKMERSSKEQIFEDALHHCLYYFDKNYNEDAAFMPDENIDRIGRAIDCLQKVIMKNPANLFAKEKLNEALAVQVKKAAFVIGAMRSSSISQDTADKTIPTLNKLQQNSSDEVAKARKKFMEDAQKLGFPVNIQGGKALRQRNQEPDEN